MKTHKGPTPLGATHFNHPFYFKVVKNNVYVYMNGEWEASAWSKKELLSDRDTMKVKPPAKPTEYMEYPEWMKKSPDLE